MCDVAEFLLAMGNQGVTAKQILNSVGSLDRNYDRLTTQYKKHRYLTRKKFKPRAGRTVWLYLVDENLYRQAQEAPAVVSYSRKQPRDSEEIYLLERTWLAELRDKAAKLEAAGLPRRAAGVWREAVREGIKSPSLLSAIIDEGNRCAAKINSGRSRVEAADDVRYTAHC